MKLPKVIESLIESFQKLPGIGPKTAQRLTFYLLNVPQSQLDYFAESLSNLKKKTVFCSVCKNITEVDPCFVCSDPSRNRKVIMVVEQPLDLIAFEKTGRFKGLYHVLHGRISPLENIGPDEIFVNDFLKRVKNQEMEEIIIATNPDMEGEATAMYLAKEIRKISDSIKITRLGMGIPTGADLEYADDLTLTQALEGRRQI
jgi:recombination protein RecR